MTKEKRKYSTWKDSGKKNNEVPSKQNDTSGNNKQRRNDKKELFDDKIEKKFPKRVAKDDFILNQGKKRSNPPEGKMSHEGKDLQTKKRINKVEGAGKKYTRSVSSATTKKIENQKYNIHSVGKKSDYKKQDGDLRFKNEPGDTRKRKPVNLVRKSGKDNDPDNTFKPEGKSNLQQKARNSNKDISYPKNESQNSNKEFSNRKLRKENTDDKNFVKSPVKAKTKKEEQSAIRLNRYISNAGVCSRRDADKLIQEGAIKVNGEVITELGYKVNPGDSIKYGNKVLRREKFVYVLLNKPKDFITTMEDPEERKTVMDLVKNACTERVFPVGRLDRNTTGLLLLTNDGELASKLTHPKYEIKKIYQVEIDSPLKTEDLEAIMNGLELEDGPVIIDDIELISKDKKTIGLEIHEGRNRIVRRIFEHLGYEVVNLDRVVYAGLTKKDLPRGKWRMLSEKEVITLKHLR